MSIWTAIGLITFAAGLVAFGLGVRWSRIDFRRANAEMNRRHEAERCLRLARMLAYETRKRPFDSRMVEADRQKFYDALTAYYREWHGGSWPDRHDQLEDT